MTVLGIQSNAAAQVKVTDLDWCQLAGTNTQYVLRLQITMSNPLVVQETQSTRNITDHVRRLFLRQVSSLTNGIQQCPTLHLLKHYVKPVQRKTEIMLSVVRLEKK